MHRPSRRLLRTAVALLAVVAVVAVLAGCERREQDAPVAGAPAATLLATADYGTALAVVFAAHEQGKKVHVFADETRPLLQGARLTAWELARRGIPVTLICDNMAAQVMREGKVDLVVVVVDRQEDDGIKRLAARAAHVEALTERSGIETAARR